jgi:hypothetical protein
VGAVPTRAVPVTVASSWITVEDGTAVESLIVLPALSFGAVVIDALQELNLPAV